MKTAGITIILLGLAALHGRAAEQPLLRTVDEVDLVRYMGKWYEIAAFPQRFEKGCHCATAEYAMTDKGFVRVVNSCRKGAAAGKLKRANGKAFVVEGARNAKLKVQFFWPFRGNYWIIDLAEDYSYAVVGDPSRKYLWILSRTPEMSPALYEEIVRRAAEKGFDTSKLKLMDQSCR